MENNTAIVKYIRAQSGSDSTQNYIEVDGLHIAEWRRRTANEYYRSISKMLQLTGIDAPTEAETKEFAKRICGDFAGTEVR